MNRLSSHIREWGLGLVLTLAVWTLFSWPLPGHIRDAIPSSAYNVEADHGRTMIPGDHLQFLYNFWLASDSLGQHFLNDVYEFNTGEPMPLRIPTLTCYFPFPLLFTPLSALAGQAAGWNLTALISLWLTFVFTRKLLRRYTPHTLLATLGALIAIMLPYRWITLLDGSPTGLTMMWVPMILLALDIMVVDRKAWAGAVAGALIYASEWGDTHVYVFCLMLAPFWCLFSYWHNGSLLRLREKKEWQSLLKAASLLILFLGLSVGKGLMLRHELSEETRGGGRSLHEVALRSPSIHGVVKFINPADNRKIYVGYALIALLALGAAAQLLARRRHPGTPSATPTRTFIIILAALSGLVILSLGTQNPAGPKAWGLLMKLVPPYGMIRQPDKIFCLMPTFLALAWVFALGSLIGRNASPRRQLTLGLLCLLPLVGDYQFRIRPTLCLLDNEQGAFKAIAEDARNAKRIPHMLSLPLWPGDSHFDSINEYYLSLYHIRMVNGYGGTVRQKYYQEIFMPFESMNLGSVSNAQLDELLRRGVHYLILHENLFPEKVSPFPAAQTLQQLLAHPRLEKLAQDRSVWAFKILPAPATKNFVLPWPTVGAACRWEWEREMAGAKARLIPPSPDTLGNGALLLDQAGDHAIAGATMAPLDAPLHGLMRVRGMGELQGSAIVDHQAAASERIHVAADTWQWQTVPLPLRTQAAPLEYRIEWLSGSVAVDSFILAAGGWTPPAPGATLSLPAASFFHAGYTTPDLQGVAFSPERDPDAVVLYGPKLPLDPGHYRVSLRFTSDAAPGTVLGRMNVRWPDREDMPWTEVISGKSASLEFRQEDNKPFFIAFKFERKGDIVIQTIELTRSATPSR